MKKMNKKSKQRMLAGVALIVVVILVASSLFVYYEYYKEEEVKEEPVIVQIDDQISPLENQALVLEVKRIRHRGLYDKLMTRGTAWKTKPSFYFVAELDGLEYSSKDVVGSASTTQVLFRTWDSMFMENKIVRDAEEEQETSTVTLAIWEQVKYGFLNRKTNNVERDKITVTYDYRTGRWTGDDYFKDYDGYGHYLGDTFEFWFNIYQMDYDRDYIPYWTEVNVLGTDPRTDDTNKDPDGDGIPTAWEWRWGYDPHVWDDHEKLDPDIDGIENIEEYKIAKWLADPYSQEVYCEVDHTGRGGRFDPPHILWEESAYAIVEKYAEHNIKLYFDMGWPDTPRNGGGEELPHYDAFSQDSGMILQFYAHHFPEERKGTFRYIVMGHGQPFNHPSVGNIYDNVHVGYTIEPKKLLRQWIIGGIPPWPRSQRIKVATTLMHELGHSLGIHPWSFEGCDNGSFYAGKAAEKHYDETWGQYRSVMNYYNMYEITLLDYSDGSNGPPYDQNDWLHLFVADFQYNSVIVEEIYFEAPGFDKIVYGETEIGVTGYIYDEEMTEQFKDHIRDWSPVDPIDANWLVFKLEYKEDYPDYKEIKILVQPNVQYAGWALYAEGHLDSKGNIQIYSAQDKIDEIQEELSE